jgi:hypothetical protein
MAGFIKRRGDKAVCLRMDGGEAARDLEFKWGLEYDILACIPNFWHQVLGI